MSESFNHLKEVLWSQEDCSVFAVINGEVLPGLPQRLEDAGLSWDCLWRGELSEEQAALAPYVVELAKEHAFTDWLLAEAVVTHAGWGVLAVGPVHLLALRQHGRHLLKIETPAGTTMAWQWYRPALWAGLLPQLDDTQLLEAFGPMNEWVIPRADAWRWLTWTPEGLEDVERQVVMPAAAG